ncbi:hemolysin III [Geothermobacter hydrogeniphilus]|uniref:Hemolysin III n=1 Tax=Geothermobacter hydrogeniphilus TaxID=1969733 RepID=A0A2K2HDD8_9BACT|nr:hemolysin III family protein [Geothermobacter hydrogeniphilus]PNU21307.1 hemolysin III [Geothermobacter hydrogeniphilus]
MAAPHDTCSEYSPGEEIANSITHGIGTLLAIGGLGVLSAYAGTHGNAWHIVTCSVFGATLIFSYLTSTLYHSIQHVSAKNILRTLDHAAIFLLIAGTYTPITLISLHGPWGWSIFGVVWGLALVGIICEITFAKNMGVLRVATYIAMGWVVVIAARPLMAGLAPGGLLLLVLGGLAYTGGVVFYAWDRLPYNHAIWHMFVLVGSTMHFFAILWYVIPDKVLT